MAFQDEYNQPTFNVRQYIMQRQYLITYTEGLLKTAVCRYFQLILGLWFPLLLVVVGAVVIYLTWMGDRSWRVGAVGALVFVITVIIGAFFVDCLRRAKASAVELAQAKVELGIGDEGLSFQSPLGSAKIPWSKIKGFHDFGEIILLQFRQGGYSSIPVASLDPEGIEAIKTCIRQAGGRVA
jgi:hypothetical protein